jgi:hypothetical protein
MEGKYFSISPQMLKTQNLSPHQRERSGTPFCQWRPHVSHPLGWIWHLDGQVAGRSSGQVPHASLHDLQFIGKRGKAIVVDCQPGFTPMLHKKVDEWGDLPVKYFPTAPILAMRKTTT